MGTKHKIFFENIAKANNYGNEIVHYSARKFTVL